MKWRNDYKTNGQPTVFSKVICAVDIIEEKDIFTLMIKHVQTINGNMFMPSVRSTGDVDGETHTKYEHAINEGKNILKNEIKKFDKQMEELDENTRKRRANRKRH